MSPPPKGTLLAFSGLLLLGFCARPVREEPPMDKVKPPLRESFQSALSGDLPDAVAASTPVELELTSEEPLPAALAHPGVRILAREQKRIAVEGLRAVDWRALVQDKRIASVALHSVNVVKARTAPGLIRTAPPRERNFLQELWGLTGEGMAVAVIDNGAVAGAHPEFQASRVTVQTTAPVEMHSTQMASIIGARGAEPASTGVAPGVRIHSYYYGKSGYTAILTAMDHAVNTARASVSNHSYGPPVGWENGDRWYGTPTFGRYDATHLAMDRFLAAHPEHCAFAAAGNERGEGGLPCQSDPSGNCCPHLEFQGGQWRPSAPCRPQDGGPTGVNTLKGACLAKNTICVTNVERTAATTWLVQGNAGLGPAEDLRIKPDLAAEGFQVNVATGILKGQPLWGHSSGTSSATALASGIGVLLVEHYGRVHGGKRPLAAEIKAALIHTARRSRPTLDKGWGVIDASAAARAIAGRDGMYAVRTTYEKPATIDLTPDGKPIRVTLVWTDPEGTPGAKALSNDLNIVLLDPAGRQVFPWAFNGTAIVQAPNCRDNVEVIDAPAGSPGSRWRLVLSASAISGPQSCALVFSGLRPMDP